jgi:hypothetical protein
MDIDKFNQILSLRKLARKADAEKYQKLDRLHRHAISLLNSERRIDVISEAERRINLWEEQGLCSNFYIDSWRRLLKLESIEIEQEVCSDSPQAHALSQNTPFSFLMNELN